MMVHRRLLALAGDIRRPLALNILLGLAVTASYIAQGLLVAQILARLLTGQGIESSVGLLVGLAAAVAVRLVLLLLAETAAQRTAHAVKERVRARLFAKLLALGPGYLTLRRSGDVRTVLVDGVEALEAYYSRYLPTAAICLLGPLSILAYLATRDPLSVLLIAVFIVVVLIGPRLLDRLVASTGEKHWGAYGRLSSDYLDVMQGMTTLKAFNAAGRERATLKTRAEDLRHATMKHLGVSLVDSGVTTLGLLAGPALAVGVGALRLAAGSVDLLTLLLVMLLARECFRPLGDLSKFWHAGYQGISSSKEIEKLLEEAPLVAESTAPVPLPRGRSAPRVTFDGVTFRYPDRKDPAVRDFTLHIAEGETVAVVGPSGAGKTTLVALLLRYFDLQQGAIAIDGVDLRDVSLDDLRANVAVVAQDTYLFTGTIADNIRLGRPDATHKEMVAAARSANIHDFISALPDGYDTAVGERGLNLSGGQRQRIAIARALLKDAPILILDEATSSVDGAAESLIQEALERVAAGRTTLIVAHRLSTVRDADRIVLMRDGVIREVGGHSELMNREGDYARLVAAQEVTA
ncbi:ATP-binding cassette, subfamily B/ATP-binding cassette, subfamily C, CydCD [Sinosporangium album]|uniref:ATP-binding cassette, subfamily B/ATP-binding cassette, subfamily C, CydCD n=1 Tax=Sinosporangium album TaxID=504805 RepID=A0A1G7Z458_9ACTN|nr:thiol reductant ABC exporter subunit CydD [Sinosporangium album]SDH03508.1 ATP-binding cassette, subfamily B/ATP-binding cassette, subfamily C, CydCD [Sinosporangium album]